MAVEYVRKRWGALETLTFETMEDALDAAFSDSVWPPDRMFVNAIPIRITDGETVYDELAMERYWLAHRGLLPLDVY